MSEVLSCRHTFSIGIPYVMCNVLVKIGQCCDNAVVCPMSCSLWFMRPDKKIPMNIYIYILQPGEVLHNDSDPHDVAMSLAHTEFHL